MTSIFETPIVPSYAAELSDSDSDVDTSDDEMGGKELDAASTTSTSTTTTATKRSRTTDTPEVANDASSGSLPAAKRARTVVPPLQADSPTVTVTAPTPPRPTVVAAADESAESSNSSNSESDDDSDDEEDDGDDETSHSQAAPVPQVSTMERCIKKYVFIVEARRRDRRVKLTWQQIVDKARRAIQYEIDNKPAVWKEGIGRAPSYLAMMKALLNVSTMRSVNRKMILEVIEQAGEVLEARWGGE